MKRAWVIWMIITLLFVGCGGKPTPIWVSNATSRLEQFKKEFLGGRMDVAEMNFNLALSEIKKSGDLEILGRAYLTKMALEAAILRPLKVDDFLALQKASPSSVNANYYAFLQGRMREVDVKFIPEVYGKFVNAWDKKGANMVEVIRVIDHPVSRLIACGIYTGRRGDEEGVLLLAVETASHEGWKRALSIYLERLASLYERKGEQEAAKKIRTRLSIIGPVKD